MPSPKSGPVVVRVGKKFLVRQANGFVGGRARYLVDTPEEATVWAKPGHAKNAVLQAWRAASIPAKAVVEIIRIEIKLVAVTSMIKRKTDRYGSVSTQPVT